MRNIRMQFSIGFAVAALSAPVIAAQLEQVQTLVTRGGLYFLVFIAVTAGLLVYFMRWRDKRSAPLTRLFDRSDALHSVEPNALVTECVRKMVAEKIGALIVTEAGKLIGIFTERDALNKVLAVGLDPRSTKVSEVMTKNPYSVSPTTTVGAAMQLVTTRRIRHLPVVQDGKVLGMISSGDLTHWLVQDQVSEVQQLVDLADQSR